MVKAMPSGDIAVKVRAKPTKVALKSASKAKTIVAKNLRLTEPWFCDIQGIRVCRYGLQRLSHVAPEVLEHLSIETWVKVQNAAADKFAAIVSAIGENKLNPISKQNVVTVLTSEASF